MKQQEVPLRKFPNTLRYITHCKVMAVWFIIDCAVAKTYLSYLCSTPTVPEKNKKIKTKEYTVYYSQCKSLRNLFKISTKKILSLS